EMHRLSSIAKPDICVITNIGQCHLENLKSRQGVLQAKSEIFDYMSDEGRVVINGDDDMLATLKEIKGNKPIQFGTNTDQTQTLKDVYVTNIVTKGLLGSSCDIHVNNKILHADIPLPGEHMILNAMAAVSVGTLLGLTPKDLLQGISTVKPLGGRSNILRLENMTIIDDCYNANPVSMKAAIDLLSMADTRRVAILGDMFELGINEKALHKEIGIYATKRKLEVLVCVGKLSSNMYDGAVEAGHPNLLYYETREELIKALPTILKDNDTILVKASHGMGFENVVKALQ
ncbi:MAG TPA: UDP-N-acetylmuramoyl-tripeptide--D-alanyl-D-alanine ligase, partial [Mobilitalea sp.]|nr:UDP-N-acetylmuramoyl-tripeptide--D-alanyl-D-alanine ligase [Mobilitalea sp.]